MPLRTRLRSDLSSAMKARDTTTVAVLRSALAAIDNAEAVAPETSSGPVVGRSADVPRRALSEEQIQGIVRAEVGERHVARSQYERLGQHEQADRLGTEIAVLGRYLDSPNADAPA